MLTNRYNDLDEAMSDYTEWYIANQSRVVTVDSCLLFLRRAIDGRLFLLHLLRDELMALRAQFVETSDLDNALDAFTHWYASNTETVVDVMPTLAFLKKATDDSLHLLHMMRNELREAQEKKAPESLLWIPTGLR